MTDSDNKKILIAPYQNEHKTVWNDFVATSKNGLFLFSRDYMDYHSDRFHDHSLMFFRKGKLIGLFPANLKDNVLYSHGGLTFGGVISDSNMSAQIMLEIFEELNDHCRQKGISKIIYKTLPYIYHLFPSDEDLYALFRHNAQLIGRGVTASIYMTQKLDFDESRTRSIKKAQKNNLVVKRTFEFGSFMEIVKNVLLEHHGVAPVHTPQEIELLATRFPNNLKLFCSYKDNKMLAGVLVFESRNVAHAQYIANSNEGRGLGALEIVFDYLINTQFRSKKYFDFGISTEQMGQVLNSGLMLQKEGFGARSIMQDIYQLTINH